MDPPDSKLKKKNSVTEIVHQTKNLPCLQVTRDTVFERLEQTPKSSIKPRNSASFQELPEQDEDELQNFHEIVSNDVDEIPLADHVVTNIADQVREKIRKGSTMYHMNEDFQDYDILSESEKTDEFDDRLDDQEPNIHPPSGISRLPNQPISNDDFVHNGLEYSALKT